LDPWSTNSGFKSKDRFEGKLGLGFDELYSRERAREKSVCVKDAKFCVLSERERECVCVKNAKPCVLRVCVGEERVILCFERETEN
jgi:hypothetical protein